MKRSLYNKQSFTELGVCQLENIVTHKDRQGFMLYVLTRYKTLNRLSIISNALILKHSFYLFVNFSMVGIRKINLCVPI